MYNITKFTQYLEDNSIGTQGQDIFIGRFDNDKGNYLITQEAPATKGNVIGKRNYDIAHLTIRILDPTGSYLKSQKLADKLYKLLIGNPNPKEIGIINLIPSQPTLLEKTQNNNYKFIMMVELKYNI